LRVYKKHDERLSEILDISENLFATKGYEKTTINDILDGVGIGKGTFYHYFKSKEEVMYAVITRMADIAKTFSQEIADTPGLSANEKILKVFADQPGRNDGIVEQLHHEDNSAMHLKSLIETVHAISPAMTQIIEQGIAEGVFSTPYPKESFEFLFAGAQFLLDLGLYKWTRDELLQKTKAFTHILEIALGAEAGCFEYIYKMNEAAVNAGTSQINIEGRTK
jgi:AcrR family transcriptional regulator